MSGLSLGVPEELVEAIASRAADLMLKRLPQEPEPWMNTKTAAAYLDCPESRINDLRARGRLRVFKDGSRNVFRREDLDAVLREEA